jgi:hypothetical protein
MGQKTPRPGGLLTPAVEVVYSVGERERERERGHFLGGRAGRRGPPDSLVGILLVFIHGWEAIFGQVDPPDLRFATPTCHSLTC